MRVIGAGVCHTDLHIIGGRWPDMALPRVLGHEIAGEAEGIGPVLVYASWGCGSCAFCKRGEEQLCPDATEAGWARDGGYKEHLVVPSRRYLIPLGDLDPEKAAPLADAGVTPYRAVRRAREWLDGGGTAVVIGCGGLGQFAVQYLKMQTDAEVVAIDLDERKRARALELGADDARAPDRTEDLAPARAVFDVVGSDETLALAARLVGPTGIVVLIGEAHGRLPFGHDAIPAEAHLTNAIWGSMKDLKAVVGLAQRGEMTWHVETMPLEKVNEALDRVRRGDVTGRLVLVP